MVMSVMAWSIISWVHLIPWLDKQSKRAALLIVVMPQMFRTVGAMAMFPGIGDPPREWALPLAWGDSITALLAMIAMIALHRNHRRAFAIAWLSTTFGFLDMLHNAYNSVALQVAPRLGPIGYVVGFGVPLMLVFHLLAYRTLLRAELNVTA
jgi:hypothetical protein